jgi:hypothetical protein
MAWNGDCHGVRSAGSGYSSGGCGLADRLGYRSVRTRRSKGDGLQMRPHASLKRSRLNIQGQSCVQALAAHLAKQVFLPGPHGFIVTAPDGKRKLVS